MAVLVLLTNPEGYTIAMLYLQVQISRKEQHLEFYWFFYLDTHYNKSPVNAYLASRSL